MSDTPSFDYDHFVQLERDELIEYMEPIVYTARVSQQALQRMRSELHLHDEYHLVYALELGRRCSPGDFAALAPEYLLHKEQCVRLAASRLLDHLPNECITPDLVDAVRRALPSCPEREMMGYLVDHLTTRMGADGDAAEP